MDQIPQAEGGDVELRDIERVLVASTGLQLLNLKNLVDRFLDFGRFRIACLLSSSCGRAHEERPVPVPGIRFPARRNFRVPAAPMQGRRESSASERVSPVQTEDLRSYSRRNPRLLQIVGYLRVTSIG